MNCPVCGGAMREVARRRQWREPIPGVRIWAEAPIWSCRCGLVCFDPLAARALDEIGEWYRRG